MRFFGYLLLAAGAAAVTLAVDLRLAGDARHHLLNAVPGVAVEGQRQGVPPRGRQRTRCGVSALGPLVGVASGCALRCSPLGRPGALMALMALMATTPRA